MAERIFLKLNDKEKRICQKLAERAGFRDANTFLHREIHSMPQKLTKNIYCEKGVIKVATPICVNTDVLLFYDRLACSHSTTLKSVIDKFVLYPAIVKFMLEEN